ncbi:MAG: phosphate ABC transporter substrate-binding protein [Verrucomicrobia bacterium]|nr:phosphate ABC transporter substrate-binding protein [Verrucomicrobiota bacterium]
MNHTTCLTNKASLLAVLLMNAAANLPARDITVKGSDTMVVLAQKWAEVYMGKNADAKIQVTGGGSGTGFSALQQNKTDLCNASRKIKPKEIEACIQAFSKRPTEYKVALDGLSVYVNEDNKLRTLSLDELEAIFTGKIKNWNEVGGHDAPITVYSRENSSGTYEFFKEHVLKNKDFVASAQTMPGTAAVLQAVAKDKNGIGYGGAAYGVGAKHLAVSREKGGEAIEPSEENVVNGKYPIWRYLFIYLNPALDKGPIGAYLSWIRSDDGQKIVKEVGYYSLPKNLRQ